MSQPTVACLDLEGVLVPEIWINVAERTGIAALRRTTRDEPDYDALMRGRLAILDEHKLGLRDIQAVIDGMAPLDGALAFLDWLRSQSRNSSAPSSGAMPSITAWMSRSPSRCSSRIASRPRMRTS